MKKTVKMLWLATILLLPFFARSQNINYSCSFDDANDSAGWILANGTQTNKWYIGTDASSTTSRALFISGTDSSSNTYVNSSTSIVYAYRAFDLTVGSYYVSYDWKANGETNYDYLRVFLAPGSATFSPGQLPNGSTSTSSYTNTVPAGWIALDGASRLNMSSVWGTYSAEINVSVADTYLLVFMWCNDGSAGSNPPAAVDNIIFTQPTCPKPVSPYISNLSTTSFDLFWSDNSGGNAMSWVVEVDSANQAHGQGTFYTVYDTTIALTDLTPNTDYTLYISAVCSGYDTSMSLFYRVHTPCNFLDSLPYYEDFESALVGSSTSNTFVNCWKRINDGTTYYGYPYVANSSSYSHNGGSKGLYWFNSSSLPTYGSYQCVVLPGVDTDIAPVRVLQLSFWGRATSSSYSPVFEVGVMTNPADITSFVPVATVNITSTNWEQFIVPMGNYAGQGSFFAVMARSNTATWYACLDEFVIERTPSCSPVNNLVATEVGTSGALLSWDVLNNTPSQPASYQVQVRPADSSTILFQTTVSTPRCMVTGLAPSGFYRAYVNVLCTNDSLSAWDSVNFSTHNMPCAVIDPTQTDTIVFSSGTNQTSGVPVNSSWGNTVCQSIYTASELISMGVTPGMISGVDYSFTNNSSYAKVFSIYITTSDRTSFSGIADMVAVRSQDLVYGPASHPLNTSGTVHYNFTTPFMWDGSSSIVITTMMNQPNGSSHSSSGFYGYSTSSSATHTIYHYQDGQQYTPANATAGSGGSSTYRPSITFYTLGCSQYDTCAAPTVILDRLDVDTVALSWIPGNEETSWNILYKADGDATWTTEATDVSINEYIFTSLAPMTSYQVRVVPNCGNGSTFAQMAFTTPCVAIATLPFTENFENFTASSSIGSPIVQCWHRGTNYSYTSYPYLSTSYSYSGTKSMYFYSSGSYYSYLALPNFAAPIDTLQVSFAAYKTSANYSIQVGVMTDPDDFTTFTSVATLSPENFNNWEMFEVPLTSYSGAGQYIAFAATGGTNYMYIDDIEVSYLPRCPRPTNVATTSITTTTATVHWDDSSANYFMIEYGPAGFSHGEGILITSSTDSVNLYGLSHSSPYDVYVRGLCISGDTSNWSFVHTFNTQCGIIDTLPFTQNFDGWGSGSGARPACWSCGGYSSYPYIMNVTDDSGMVVGHTLYLYSYGSNQVYAMLPQLDSVSYPSHIVQTVFRAWTNSSAYTSYSHDVIVGLSAIPGDITSFTPVDTITLATVPTDYEVAFDAFPGAGQYVTFISTSTGGANYNYVYIDSIAVELIPDCQRPNNIAVSNLSPNSATITWNDRNTSMGFQVEWLLHGFAIGSGTRAITTASPYTISGLLPSTTYDVYVRSICAPGDTSQWSLAPITFSTMQNPAPVPYFYDFETSTEWDNWQTVSNSSINWFRDTAAGNGTNGFDATGSYAMFVSPDSGATYGTRNTEVVNATAYRDFDFGTIDSSYMLTFRAKAGGTTSAGYDGLMVFLVDPNVEVLPSSINLETPWGNVQDMTYLTFVRLSTNWNTYSAILDTLTGIHRLAFYWFNQNTASLEGNFIGGPGAVDDLRIEYIDCPRPAGVRATDVSMASATVTWHGPVDGDYRVICRSIHGSIIVNELVHTNSISITGLSPASTYNVYVRRICSATDSSQLSLPGSFTTLICNDSYIDTIGDNSTNTTSSILPVANNFNYTYSQQIITADELSAGGEISAINFRYSASTAMTAKTNCTIYMGHTTLSSFASRNDFVDPASLQMVYSGNLNCGQGWNRFILEYPFIYNGADNLVIAIDDNSGNYNSSTYTFYASPCSGTRAITLYSDSQNPDATSSATLAAYSGSAEVSALRTQMIVEICPPNACPMPIVREPIVRSTGVLLRWRNTAESYQVSYRRAQTSSWLSTVTTTDTFFTINSVYPNTDYVYRVRQYCDSTALSNWVIGSFNSSDIPCLSPMNLEVTSLTNNKASFNWDTEENNIGYRLHVFNSSYDRTITRYIHNGTVSDLEANVTYYAAVQAICQGFDDPSAWSDTIRFTTDLCPDATNLTYSDLQGNSVVIDWTEGGRAEEWEIQYGPAGFSQGTGTSIIVDHHPYTITGLTGETLYDIYVRAICGQNFYSEHWSNGITIETPFSGLSSIADDARLQLYPNPADASVAVTLSGVQGRAVITLMDIAGRTLHQHTVADAAAQPTYLLDLNNIPAGSYFVRVTGDNITAVRKLVVK